MKSSSPSVRRTAHPRISEAELRVMRVLWRQAPATANAVVEALAPETQWKPKTIHTLLRRLVAKGAVRFEKQGREHVFQAAVNREDYAHQASRSFLERFFGGEVAPFLACFLKREKLTPAEVGELRRLLDDPPRSGS